MDHNTLRFESNRSLQKLFRGLGSLTSQRLGRCIARQARRIKFLGEINTLLQPKVEPAAPPAQEAA